VGGGVLKVRSTRFKFLIEDRDRHGNVRVYLRLPGKPKVRLRADPETVEFLAEYQAAVAGELVTAAPRKPSGPAPGTLHALCVTYYQSDSFLTLAPRTQRVRRLALDRLCAAVGKDGKAHGTRLAADMGPNEVRALRGPLGKPGAANEVVKALRLAFAAGIEAGTVTRNPARDVRLLPSKNPDGFHSWNPAEVAQFEARHPVGTVARLALALLIYTGCRREDAARLAPSMLRDGWLHYTQSKNRQRKPVHMVVPVHPELADVLAASPIGAETFIVSATGRPYTPESFGNKFRDWCNEAGLPHCSAHGLRKAAAAKLAEAGATTNEIAAVTGHRTLKEVARYTAAASQKAMAGSAMGRITSATTIVKSPTPGRQSPEWDKSSPQPVDKSGAGEWMVPRGGIEPPTLRFSVACSTN
jgi:integrase